MADSIKNKISALRQGDISKKLYATLLITLILLKLCASAVQIIAIYPDAPIDDGRMFEAAQSIGEGRWLGDYNWLTLSKHMFFSVWLWLLNVLHIPYLIGGQLLFLLGCIVSVRALCGSVIKRRVTKLVVFTFMWYMPYSWAESSLRVYRDNISLSLCLIFFAGVLGVCLGKGIGFSLAAGIGGALSYITREDAIWMLPFGICAFLVYVLWAILSDERKKQLMWAAKALAVMALSAAVVLLCYAGMNYRYYGCFTLSTNASPAFSRAVSLMVSLDEDMPHIGLMVCRETREKIAKESELMREFCAELDNGSYYHGYTWKFATQEDPDFGAGGYSWMMKKAAYNLGADSPDKEDAFWNALADDIEKAISEGRLTVANNSLLTKISPFIMPWDSSFMPLTVSEVGSSLKVLFGFLQNSSIPQLSIVDAETGNAWRQYTHSIFANYIARYGTAELDVLFPQLIVEWIYKLILWVYRLCYLPLFLFGLYFMIKKAVQGIKRLPEKKFSDELLLAILLFGLLLSAAIRIVMVAYIEVTSFLIGTYLMYLAAAGAVLFLFTAVALGYLVDGEWEK